MLKRAVWALQVLVSTAGRQEASFVLRVLVVLAEGELCGCNGAAGAAPSEEKRGVLQATAATASAE